jgi:hypothetical protein
MSHRQFTDAWGDRWDAVQDDANPENGALAIHFRHQSGRTVSAPSLASLDSLTTRDLLALLETVRLRAGVQRSVVDGHDSKIDPEGYTNPEPGTDSLLAPGR